LAAEIEQTESADRIWR